MHGTKSHNEFFLKEDRYPDFVGRVQEDDSDSGNGGSREAALEEIAKHTQFTLEELRDLSDEELRKVIESVDIDLHDALNARVSLLETRANQLFDSQDRDDDVEGFEVDGAFTAQDRDGSDDAGEDDDVLADVQVGGAFETMRRQEDD